MTLVKTIKDRLIRWDFLTSNLTRSTILDPGYGWLARRATSLQLRTANRRRNNQPRNLWPIKFLEKMVFGLESLNVAHCPSQHIYNNILSGMKERNNTKWLKQTILKKASFQFLRKVIGCNDIYRGINLLFLLIE